MTQPNSDSTPAPAALVEAAPLAYAPAPKSLAFQTRMWCLFILVLCVAMLGIGLYMKPSSRGYGTHSENLLLPPCGFLAVTGIPCPTCGCTTAVTWFAHGNLWMAVKTQPFGAAVGMVAAILLVLSLLGLITGRWFGPQPFTLSWHWRALLYGSLAFLLAGWFYKIAAMKAGW